MSAALLGQVQQRPRALRGHPGDRAAQLRPAVAAQAAQQVAGEALRVDAHQRRIGFLGPANDDGEMLDACPFRAECDHRESAAFSSGTRAEAIWRSPAAAATG